MTSKQRNKVSRYENKELEEIFLKSGFNNVYLELKKIGYIV